jgi:hypothetical protein
MLERKTLTLTTLLKDDAEALRTAARLANTASVSSSMVPVMTFPSLSAGIWPETKTRPLAFMAWDYIDRESQISITTKVSVGDTYVGSCSCRLRLSVTITALRVMGQAYEGRHRGCEPTQMLNN